MANNADVRTIPGPRPRVTFVMPPPMTLFVELNNGMRVSMPIGLPPTSSAFLASLMGLQGPSFPTMFFGSEDLNHSMEEDGLMRVLHDLFVRNQAQQTGPPPTSRAFLDTIPVKKWSVESSANEKHCDCSICLCDYEVNDEVLPLPCGHQFHKDCGMPWLVEHNVCPTCRYELPTKESEVSKPQDVATATQPVASSSRAIPQPEAEPETQDVSTSQSRIRPRSPRRQSIRVVRRRLSETESIVLPNVVSSSNDDELDNLLEETATKFVAEEMRKQQMEIDFDDVDVEELLRETSQ